VSPAPNEHQHSTCGAILKRLLPVLVAGLALYGLAPALGEVFGVLPACGTSSPIGSR
jgi:hypothetical protein